MSGKKAKKEKNGKCPEKRQKKEKKGEQCQKKRQKRPIRKADPQEKKNPIKNRQKWGARKIASGEKKRNAMKNRF